MVGGGLPPLPAQREVFGNHLKNLRESGLTDETITLADLYTETHRPALARLLNWNSWPISCCNGLVFPFFLPGAAEPMGYRVRPTYPRTVGTHVSHILKKLGVASRAEIAREAALRASK